MKVRVSPALSVAEAVRMARGLGCDLRLEDGEAYLVRYDRATDRRERHTNTEESRHGSETDT